MLKRSAFYIFATIFIFAGQFLLSSNLVTGLPPRIEQTTLNGQDPMQSLAQGPALLYFWAEWCGVCRTMQNNVDAVLQDYPGMTVAVRSDDRQKLTNYLAKNQLNWPTINDVDGVIGQRYGIRGVPALFFINQQGSIVFTSIGYTSEWGLRIRLWLASMF